MVNFQCNIRYHISIYTNICWDNIKHSTFPTLHYNKYFIALLTKTQNICSIAISTGFKSCNGGLL